MTWISDPVETRRDHFLGGAVQADQPLRGFRSGLDAVLLAAATPAVPGERVLDMGCGAGVAGLCLAARVPQIELHGLEIQPDYGALARDNAALNGRGFTLHRGDVAEMPPALRQVQFDHVIANPPYFDRRDGISAPLPAREMAQAGQRPLGDWVRAAARRLAPRGRLTMICRAERLPDLLHAAEGHLGALMVLPLAPRAGRAARLILLTGFKDGRAPFALLSPLVLHQGDRHESDAEDYTPAIAQTLRTPSPLPAPVEWARNRRLRHRRS